MSAQPFETKRQGSDQELAAVEKTASLVMQMVDFLFQQEAQWQPEVVAELAAAMAKGSASLRIQFDTDTSGLVSLKVYALRAGGAKRRLVFDITPTYKLDS